MISVIALHILCGISRRVITILRLLKLQYCILVHTGIILHTGEYWCILVHTGAYWNNGEKKTGMTLQTSKKKVPKGTI